ncbi:MAG: hypothetical protein R3Y28_05600 [Candidatus Gastranaerophilales bacterium]
MQITNSLQSFTSKKNQKPNYLSSESLNNKSGFSPVMPTTTIESQSPIAKAKKFTRNLMAATMLASATLTAPSCTKDIVQNNTVIVDLTETNALLQEIVDNQEQQNEQLAIIIKYLESIDSKTQELIDLSSDLLSQGLSIIEILGQISDGQLTTNDALTDIIDLLTTANENDQEFLDKLDEIISGQGESYDMLTEILEANNEQNETLLNIAQILELIYALDQDSYSMLGEFYNDYKEGNLTLTELISKVLAETVELNEGNDDIIDAINELTTKLEKGTITTSEALAEVIELLGGINENTLAILEAIQNLSDQIASLQDMLTTSGQTTNELLATIITQNETISALLTAGNSNTEDISETLELIASYLETSNANDEEFKAKLDEIINGQGTSAEKLDEIIATNTEQNETLLNIAQILDVLATNDSNTAEILEKFYTKYMEGNITLSALLSEILEEVKESNESDADIVAAIETLTEKLDSGIVSSSEAMAELLELLSSIDTTLSSILSAIDGLSDQLDELQDMLKDGGENTTELLETLISQNETMTTLLSAVSSNTEDINETLLVMVDCLKTSNANDEEFKAKLDEIINGQGTSAEKLDEIIATNTEQNETLLNIAQILDVLATNDSNTAEILEKFYTKYMEGNITLSALLSEILEEVKESNESDADVVSAINTLTTKLEAGLITASEAMEELLALVENIDGTLSEILSAITEISSQIDDLNDLVKEGGAYANTVINKLIEQNEAITELLQNNTSDDVSEVLNSIVEYLEKANSNDEAFLDKLDEIIEGQGTTNDKLDDILETNEEQNETLAYIALLLDSTSELLPSALEALDNIYNEFANGNITQNELLSEMLVELKVANVNDETMIAKMDALMTQFSAGSITAAEMLEEIIDLLGDIKDNTAEILSEVKNLASTVTALAESLTESQQEIIEGLGDLNSNIGSKLDTISDKIDTSNDNLVSILNNTSAISATLEELEEKTVSKAELEEMLGDLYDDVSDNLTSTGGSFDVSDIQEALDALVAGMTTTNSTLSLMQQTLENLNLDGNAEAIEALTQAVADANLQNTTDNSEIISSLATIIVGISDMDGVLDALLESSDALLAEQQTANAQAVVDAEKLYNALLDLSDKVVDADTFSAYMESFQDSFAALELIETEQALIQQAISDKIDGLATEETLNAFMESVDLSTIHRYLEIQNTLTESIYTYLANSSSSSSGTSVDFTSMEASINNILDYLQNSDMPTATQLEELNTQLEAILAELERESVSTDV